MTDADDGQARRVSEAVRDAGLQRFMSLEPDTVTRAWRLAQTYGERLGRPAAPQDEPAHVYRAVRHRD